MASSLALGLSHLRASAPRTVFCATNSLGALFDILAKATHAKTLRILLRSKLLWTVSRTCLRDPGKVIAVNIHFPCVEFFIAKSNFISVFCLLFIVSLASRQT